jgi:hypothetical protein
LGINSGIIVGKLQHDQNIPYNWHSKLNTTSGSLKAKKKHDIMIEA